MTSLPGKIRTGSLFPSSSVSNLSRFQTKETHLKSKLVYFGARWYDPSVGRWLSPDPLGDIDGPNRYIYLQNSPVNDLDPWGLCGGPGFFGWVRDWLQRLSEIFTPSAWGSELRRKPVHDVGQGGGGGGGGGKGSSISPPPYPTDPTKSPGAGWEWRGRGQPGSREGRWYNPTTRESLHPDPHHGPPFGPHTDYRAPDGRWYRVYPDGRVEPKQ